MSVSDSVVSAWSDVQFDVFFFFETGAKNCDISVSSVAFFVCAMGEKYCDILVSIALECGALLAINLCQCHTKATP